MLKATSTFDKTECKKRKEKKGRKKILREGVCIDGILNRLFPPYLNSISLLR